MKRSLIARLFTGLCLFQFIAAPAWSVTVLNTNDSGPGSLRDAIASHASFIDFSPAVFSTPQTILLQSRLPSIESNVWIDGPGANLLTINGLNRANNDALITIFDSFPVVRLEGFTLTGGNDPISTGNVGGIFTRSSQLTLEKLVVTGNQGTGIFNQGGTVIVNNSTLSGNTREGFFNQVGTLSLVNSTVALNTTIGVYNQVGNLTIRNSTIAGNSQGGVASGISGGPTIQSLIIESTILADNGQFDLSYDSITTEQNTLVEHGTSLANGVNGNIVGFDPNLGPLAMNGGPTPTKLPLPNSRAINAGSNSLGLTTDQRGLLRTVGGRIDIGAVETVPEPATMVLLLMVAFATASGRKRHLCSSRSQTQI